MRPPQALPSSRYATWVPLIALAVLAQLKFTLLVLFGPLTSGDSVGYVMYSDHILADTSWLHTLDLSPHAIIIDALRAPGYPLVLTFFRRLLPGDQNWPIAVVVFQATISLVVSWQFARFLHRMGFGPAVALGLTLAQGTTFPLLYDQMILTDSLNASLMTLVTLGLLTASLDSRLTLARATVMGAALIACFLLREATTLIGLLLAPLALVAIWASTRHPLRIAVLMALVFVPMLLVSQLQSAWNAARTGGSGFVTTGLQTALMLSLVQAQAINPDVFSGTEPLDVAGRTGLHTGEFDDVLAINTELHDHYGLNGLQIAQAVRKKYWETWGRHPWTMLATRSRELKETTALQFVRPVDTVDDVIGFARPDQHHSLDLKHVALRVVQDGALQLAPLAIFDAATRVASVTLFFAFLTFPLIFWRKTTFAKTATPTASPSLFEHVHARHRESPAQVALLGCWFFATGSFFAYLAVHYEHRYMAPALPAALVVAAWHLRQRLTIGLPK